MTRTREDLSKLTVVELRAALKALGKPILGKKEELVERLLAAESGAGPAATAEAAAADAAAAAAAAAPQAVASAAAPDAAAGHKAPAAGADAPAAAGNGASTPKFDPEPASEDGSKGEGTGKRAKIEFSEAAIKQMPAKITVIKTLPSEPLKATKSETEKLKERADRFKDPEVNKVKQRAERFGLFNADIEKEKAKKRAERFGTYNADLNEERKQKRAERFGIEDPEAKMAARAERFKGSSGPLPIGKPAAATGSVDFEALKKARAQRFNLTA